MKGWLLTSAVGSGWTVDDGKGDIVTQEGEVASGQPLLEQTFFSYLISKIYIISLVKDSISRKHFVDNISGIFCIGRELHCQTFSAALDSDMDLGNSKGGKQESTRNSIKIQTLNSVRKVH